VIIKEDIIILMNLLNNFKFIYWIFGLVVVALIIVLGCYVLFSDYFSYIPWNFRVIFAFLILSIGTFRLVNVIVKYKRNRYEDEDE
jgi:hypothetical protein